MEVINKMNEKKSLYSSKVVGVKKGQCYSNVFRVVSIYPELLEEGTKIVLGYTDVTDWGILNRHMWLKDDVGIIDPTYVLYNNEKIVKCDYYAVKELAMADYIEILCKEGASADLLGEFREEEINFNIKVRETKGLNCINELDFYNFVHPYLKKKIGT